MTLASLALLLPLGAYLLVWGLLAAHRARLGLAPLSRRGLLAAAFVAFEAVLALMTEALNVGHLLTPGGVAAAWLAVVVVLAASFVVSGAAARASGWVRAGGLRRAGPAAPRAVLVVGGVLLGLIAVALLAELLLYPPNNADSHVYHLARVAHWTQAGSIDHYATHATTQLELAPLHELNMLHLHLLGGTDRLDGLVQVAALVICALGASEIARLLGAGSEAQLGAALVTALLPSALLEAASTQNNLFAAATAVGLVVVVLAWEPLGPWPVPAVALGTAVGVSVLAKGTVLPLVGPAVVLLGARVAWLEARGSSWRAVAGRLACVGAMAALVALVLVGPFWSRNLQTFDSVGGPATDDTLNSGFAVADSTANVVRSIAVQFRVGDDGSDPVSATSRAVLGTLERVHGWTGAPIDDPAYSLGFPVDVFAPGDFSEYERAEDYGSNPWHVLLIGVTFIGLAVRALRGGARDRLALLLGVGLVVGFVLFTATTRWSLFVTRYQLPLLALWAPLIALVLHGINRYVLRAVVVLLLVASIPQLLENSSRPLLDRREADHDLAGYFAPRPDRFPVVPPEDYVAVRDAVVASGCDRVGIANWVVYEYPLWVALDQGGWEGEIQHVDLTNETAELEDEDFTPCALVRQTLQFTSGALEPLEGWETQAHGGLEVSFRCNGRSARGWERMGPCR